ncbi:Rv1733c family protein [Actinacidiphila oryziradicis]|uniref:Rv1733c family protein n=1 Tax=Actinacidiphila oryziradicis TaxID=2571141 RepID=UPI0026ADC2B0|nr:hypothetical protein [Actinacidiphila oryziradicis]
MRWTVSDGSSATGKGLVEPGSEAGSRTTVWLDRQGALKNDLATPGQLMATGIVFGTFAAGGRCLLVLGGRWAVRVWLDRRRDAEWENEWALVGPQWGHRRA